MLHTLFTRVATAGRGPDDSQSGDIDVRSSQCGRTELASKHWFKAHEDNCLGLGPQDGMLGVRRDQTVRSSCESLHARPVGLVLYPEHALERMDVKVGLSQQFLELGVLGFPTPQL